MGMGAQWPGPSNCSGAMTAGDCEGELPVAERIVEAATVATSARVARNRERRKERMGDSL